MKRRLLSTDLHDSDSAVSDGNPVYGTEEHAARYEGADLVRDLLEGVQQRHKSPHRREHHYILRLALGTEHFPADVVALLLVDPTLQAALVDLQTTNPFTKAKAKVNLS